MEKIIERIVRQTGVEVINLAACGYEGMYYLFYDRNCSVCVGFNQQWSNDEFVSIAWSCGCCCYVNFAEGNVELYGAGLDEPECYNEELVLKNFETFIQYCKRYLISNEWTAFNYLCDKYLQIAEVCIEEENGSALDLLSKVWQDKVEDVPQKYVAHVADLLQGFDYNGLHIKPISSLIRHFLAAQVVDSFSVLQSKDEDLIKSLKAAKTRGYRTISTMFVPQYAVRNLLAGNVLNKKQAEITIFDPFVWGVSPVVETVKQLRLNGFNGRIIVIGFAMMEPIIKPLKLLLSEYNVDFNIEGRFGLVEQWDGTFDYVLVFPPYKMLDSIMALNGMQAMLHDEGIDYNAETMPVKLMQKAINAVADNGRIISSLPGHILHEPEFKEAREQLSAFLKIRSVIYMGDFLFTSGFRGSTCVVFDKSVQISDVYCRWCTDSVNGFDDSLRQNRLSQSNMPADKEIIGYYISAAYFDVNDWSAMPLSQRSILNVFNHEKAKDDSVLTTVSNIFQISSGVVTGYNKAYVIDYWQFRGLPPEEQVFFRPAANGYSIHDGKLTDEQYVFFPFGEDKAIESERQLKRQLPVFSKHIIAYKEIILRKRKDVAAKWWEPENWSNSHLQECPKLYSLLTGRKGSLVFDPISLFIPTGAYMWRSRSKVALNEADWLVYLAIFSSDYFWKVLSVYVEPTITSAGPTFKLTKKVLDNVMIPNVKKFPEHLKATLARYGYEIMSKGCSEVGHELNTIVNRIYDGEI